MAEKLYNMIGRHRKQETKKEIQQLHQNVPLKVLYSNDVTER